MKTLALVDAPDHVCCRYRIQAFEPALRQAGSSLTVRALAGGACRRLFQFASAAEYDAVILQRKLLPGWQLYHLRRCTRQLVFDFDDAVLYRDSYDARGPHCHRRAGRFARTVRLADTVIAGNDFLADCALRAGAKPERVRVIPTCVDPQSYPTRTPSLRDDGTRLELVWIGSSSTLQGLERRRTLWERLGREVEGIRLRVICDRFPRFDHMPVEPVAWNGATEAADLARGDIGISWLPDDLWSRGKCGLKLLQYQAAGLPVIANPVGVHPEMVVHGGSGWLAATDDDWVDAARRLADDRPLRVRMGAAARASVEAGYSVAAWAETFAASVVGSAPAAPARARAPHGGRTRRARESKPYLGAAARRSRDSEVGRG